MSGGGEPLHAVLDRAIREAVAVLDREVKEAFASHELRLPAPPLPRVPPLSGCLRDWTITRWEKDLGPPWPNGERSAPNPLFFPDDYRKAMEYRVERDARRAVIEVLNQWERGELELWNLRRDGAWELLPTHLRHSPAVILHVHTGRFVPAPPDDPLKYSELKVLQPAPAAAPHELELTSAVTAAQLKQEWQPGDAPKNLRERVAQILYDLHQSREINVTGLPGAFDMATKVQTLLEKPISKATLDRGLELARKALRASC